MKKPNTAAGQQPENREQDDLGLTGMFGHTYVDDADHPSGRSIQYQFQIVRRYGDNSRCIVQYFSFVDGSPSQLGVMTEAELLGPDVKLYPTAELWNNTYQQQEERYWKQQRANREAAK